MLKKCLILLFALLLFLFLLFNNRNFPVEKDSYLGWDVRRFQTTKAWELAKAIEDNDLQEMYLEVIDSQLFAVNTVEKWIGFYLWVHGK